jgi:hypothetical protein
MILALCVGISICQGQEKQKTHITAYPVNSLFIEIGGSSLFFGSVNYERVLLNRHFFYLTGRAGAGYGSFMGSSVLSAPLMINGIFQIYRSLAFEIGTGISLMRIGMEPETGGSDWTYTFTPAIAGSAGLRVQAKNGFLFKLDVTPMFAEFAFEDPVYQFYPWMGFSLGYSFGQRKSKTPTQNK